MRSPLVFGSIASEGKAGHVLTQQVVVEAFPGLIAVKPLEVDFEHQALQELLVPEAGVEPARRVNGTGF